MGDEVFPCKGYVYSASKHECHLTAESGIVSESVKIGLSGGLKSELSTISAGQYLEKFCLTGRCEAFPCDCDL